MKIAQQYLTSGFYTGGQVDMKQASISSIIFFAEIPGRGRGESMSDTLAAEAGGHYSPRNSAKL